MAEIKLKVKTIPLKSYTIKEMRQFYGLPERIFTEWLKPFKKELNIGAAKYLTVNQVKFIFEKFGVPGEIIVE